MPLGFIIILVLPILLHIRGNSAVLVFLLMNSIINILIQYTWEQMKILGALLDNKDKINKDIEEGKTYEGAFTRYMENLNHERAEELIPKPIALAKNISMTISIAAISVGLVNIIRNLL